MAVGLLCDMFFGAVCFVSCLVLFRSYVFRTICIAVASLGEGPGASLIAFRAFVRLCLFGFVCFLYILVSGMGCGFVIVALPGLFSYLFLKKLYSIEIVSLNLISSVS